MADELPFVPFCFLVVTSSTYFRWSLMILFSCFVWVFGSYFMYLTWNSNKRTVPMIKWSCLVIALCFMIDSVLWCIHVATGIWCLYDFDIEEWIKVAIAAIFFNQIGLAMMYLLYVLRLSYPFKGTVLATSSFLWIVMLIGFFLMFVFGTLFILVLAAAPMDKWEVWGLKARIAYQTTNLFFTIILLTIFGKKMLMLHDASLLKQVIKVIICAVMGLLSSQLLDTIISSVRQNGDTEILWSTHIMLLMWDQIINLFSIYLQFPFGSKTFDRLCGKCEFFCRKKVIAISGLKDVIELETKSKCKPPDASTTSTNVVTLTGTSGDVDSTLCSSSGVKNSKNIATVTAIISPDCDQNTTTTVSSHSSQIITC